ncbi:hypothetical protein Roomu1_00017 [Pseudomonas phage vB_PpuP-Roomu-1]
MKRAQGGHRSKPDGFLHIQNFTVTKASGMAGAIYAYVLDEHQQHAVECLLVERAIALEEAAGPEWAGAAHHFKHGQWRFRKAFLKENFKYVLHDATRVMATPVMIRFEQKVVAEREALFNPAS